MRTRSRFRRWLYHRRALCRPRTGVGTCTAETDYTRVGGVLEFPCGDVQFLDHVFLADVVPDCMFDKCFDRWCVPHLV